MPSAPWSVRFPIFLPVNSSFCRWQRPQITCEPRRSRLYQRSRTTGRFRSGQTEQTVNLLALRLRWFESSPAHFPRLDYFRRLLLRFRAGDFLPLFEAFAVFRFFPRAGCDFFFAELRDLVDALERAAFAFDFEELAFFELVLADFFATDFASFFAFLTTFLAFGSKGFPLAAARPARAPRTPPTTVPIGPATLPTTAPAAAPAICFEMGGTSMFSDPPASFLGSLSCSSVIGRALLYVFRLLPSLRTPVPRQP